MKTVISAILFFISKAQELNLYQDIRLSSEDLLSIRALISATSEFTNDQVGLEILLTSIKEMLQFAKDPAQHCINVNDFSVVAMTIDAKQFESALNASSSTPQLNQLKTEVMDSLK